MAEDTSLPRRRLQRFRLAGNITFSEPKPAEVQKNFLEIEVTGKRFRLDGMPDFLPDRKSTDLDAYERGRRSEAWSKVNAPDSAHKEKSQEEKVQIVEAEVQEAVQSKRALLRERCDRRTEEVTIKPSGLKTSHTLEELKKPFVIVSMVADSTEGVRPCNVIFDALLSTMARPLRIEYKEALYHVTTRGNARMRIFKDDGDRDFIDSLACVVLPKSHAGLPKPPRLVGGVIRSYEKLKSLRIPGSTSLT